MPFLLSFIDHMDTIGDAKIEDVLTDYIAFYQDRINKGLPVDRPSCPYNAETLKDRKMIKSSMLTNPFEKFERNEIYVLLEGPGSNLTESCAAGEDERGGLGESEGADEGRFGEVL